MERQLLKQKYAHLFEERLLDEMIAQGVFRKFEANQTIGDIGLTITHIPFIINGTIKIVKEDGNGGEYLVYYVEEGNTCITTLNCYMRDKRSSVRATTEKPTSLVMFPIERMENWLVKYKSWRMFVLDSYDQRTKEMLGTINSLAFENTEERLYRYLKDRATVLETSVLEITHHKIAIDLNTSRVVISRLIKKLVLDGKVSTNRNQITVAKLTLNHSS